MQRHSSQRSGTELLAPRLLRIFPGLERAQNLIQRGLTDFGALAHAVISIANLGTIDRGQPLLFYCEGLSAKAVVLLEQMEREFGRVADAYETTLITMTELLDRYYGCRTESLLEAMRSVVPYQLITERERRFAQRRLDIPDVARGALSAPAATARAGAVDCDRESRSIPTFAGWNSRLLYRSRTLRCSLCA